MAVARRAATDSPTNTGATATRQRLLDAAVDRFIETGYFATKLTDITSRANVTTGAFYHHFASKEAVATAIVEQGWSKVIAEVTRCLNNPAPGLERVIVTTFQISDLMKRDKSVGIANHLAQAFGRTGVEFDEFGGRYALVADQLGQPERVIASEIVKRCVTHTVLRPHRSSGASGQRGGVRRRPATVAPESASICRLLTDSRCSLPRVGREVL